MPDLACAAAAARTTPLAPIRPAISISTRVIRLLTTPILGSEVPGDFSRVNPLALLRARRQRPRNRSAADERDERPTFQLTALHRLPLTTVTDDPDHLNKHLTPRWQGGAGLAGRRSRCGFACDRWGAGGHHHRGTVEALLRQAQECAPRGRRLNWP